MTEEALHIVGLGEIVSGRVCYWHEKNENEDAWYIYLPKCGAGSLRNHTVAENPDGTITVSPSILIRGHDKGVPMQRHGYLRNGIWEEV